MKNDSKRANFLTHPEQVGSLEQRRGEEETSLARTPPAIVDRKNVGGERLEIKFCVTNGGRYQE